MRHWRIRRNWILLPYTSRQEHDMQHTSTTARYCMVIPSDRTYPATTPIDCDGADQLNSTRRSLSFSTSRSLPSSSSSFSSTTRRNSSALVSGTEKLLSVDKEDKHISTKQEFVHLLDADKLSTSSSSSLTLRWLTSSATLTMTMSVFFVDTEESLRRRIEVRPSSPRLQGGRDPQHWETGRTPRHRRGQRTPQHQGGVVLPPRQNHQLRGGVCPTCRHEGVAEEESWSSSSSSASTRRKQWDCAVSHGHRIGLFNRIPANKMFLKNCPLIIVRLHCCERYVQCSQFNLVLIASNYVRFHRLRWFHKNLPAGQKCRERGNHYG